MHDFGMTSACMNSISERGANLFLPCQHFSFWMIIRSAECDIALRHNGPAEGLWLTTLMGAKFFTVMQIVTEM